MIDLSIISFCARECELQQSGERSVARMVQAWIYAQKNCIQTIRGGLLPSTIRFPTVDDVLQLGALVEPFKNANGFRQVGVRVGWDVKPDWQDVPRQMVNLMEAVYQIGTKISVGEGISRDAFTPAEFCREYLEIHPWVDGNGRSSAILYNWLSGTLNNPDWHGNWWNDSRRLPGDGAPRE